MYYMHLVEGGPEDASFWSALRSCSAPACIGYTNYVRRRFARDIGRVLFNALADGKRLGAAIDSAIAFADQSSDWELVGGIPADGEVEHYFSGDTAWEYYAPSLLAVAGDSSFRLLPPEPYYPVPLDTVSYDTGWAPSVNWFFPPSDSDSVVVVPGIDGDSVPLRRYSSSRATSHGDSVFTVRIDSSLSLRAESVYLNAMSIYGPAELKDSNVVRVVLYFSDSSGVTTHTKDLQFHHDFRNYWADGKATSDTVGIACDIPMYDEPPSGNTVEIASRPRCDSCSDAPSDLIRIPVLAEHRELELDSIQILIFKSKFGVDASCVSDCSNGWIAGYLYIPAVTVKRAQAQ